MTTMNEKRNNTISECERTFKPKKQFSQMQSYNQFALMFGI